MKDTPITLPSLHEHLTYLIGDNEKISIPKKLEELLSIKIPLIKTDDGGPLYYLEKTPTGPIVWHWFWWHRSQEKLQKDKDRAHRQKVEYDILQMNIKIVSKRLVYGFGFDKQWAESLARSLLNQKKTDRIREIVGITKLIEREEEL